MKNKDQILHGMICNRTIRFVAVSGADIVRAAQKTHALSRVATAALGRQLMMTSMIAAQLKNGSDTVTTMIAGDGPAGNLVCVGRYGGLVKGYASVPETELPLRADGKLDVRGYVGMHGKLTVIRDLGLKEPYVGLCNLCSGEIAEDFAQYFTASEQQPSLVYLGVRERAEDGVVLGAGGLLIQPLPNCPDAEIGKVEAIASAIPMLTERLSEGDGLKEILDELFSNLQPEYTKEDYPSFSCDCTRDRLERALLSIGAEELQDIIETDGQAELTCQFCLKRYHFDRQQLEMLLDEGLNAGDTDEE